MTINLAPPSPTGSSGQPEGSGPGALHLPEGRQALLFGLAPRGVWPASGSHRSRWALTPPFHPYSPEASGMFLCHFPSGHPAWALPSALPGGARTFLPSAQGGPAVTRSTGPASVYHRYAQQTRSSPAGRAVTGMATRHPKLVRPRATRRRWMRWSAPCATATAVARSATAWERCPATPAGARAATVPSATAQASTSASHATAPASAPAVRVRER